MARVVFDVIVVVATVVVVVGVAAYLRLASMSSRSSVEIGLKSHLQ